MKVGDLVRMNTHGTDYIGVVVDREPKDEIPHPQIGIMWVGGSGTVDWEPEGWLEVVSESR